MPRFQTAERGRNTINFKQCWKFDYTHRRNTIKVAKNNGR